VKRLVELKFCTVERDETVVTTRFPDGTSVPAVWHSQDFHYRVISHRLGYGDDIAAYAFEHEVCHALVEERFYDRPSRVLWALAHGSMLSGKDAAYEEIAAQTLQRWLRANERPILSGIDWDRLKADALRMFELCYR
jgi:hypothetical protein